MLYVNISKCWLLTFVNDSFVIVKSTFVSVFTIKRHKGASVARARGVLLVKIPNKCILSILVYNLFLDRQRNILYTPQ